jgi:hypothetical protein
LASGASAWLAANLLFPNGQELWVAFLIGGLLGVLLYRFWTMLLTSSAGVLLGSNSLLAFIDRLFHFDSVAFAERNALMLNGAIMAVAVLGVVVQSLFERIWMRLKKRLKKMSDERQREKIIASAPKPKVIGIWDRMLGRGKKAA